MRSAAHAELKAGANVYVLIFFECDAGAQQSLRLRATCTIAAVLSAIEASALMDVI